MHWLKWSDTFAFDADRVLALSQDDNEKGTVTVFFTESKSQKLGNTTVAEVLNLIKKAQKGTTNHG